MGWFEWIAETGRKVAEAIRTGAREFIELHPELRPYIPFRPAPPEVIEEIVEELIATDRFIEEGLPEEAVRLARGVLAREPLRNKARVRQWTAMDLTEIPASPKYQISVRGVLIAPDGTMQHVDVAFPTGEKYTYDEFVRRAASSLEDKFVKQYDVGRSDMIRQWMVAQEGYIQTYVPLKGPP